VTLRVVTGPANGHSGAGRAVGGFCSRLGWLQNLGIRCFEYFPVIALRRGIFSILSGNDWKRLETAS
jgi:hypothetical protein